MAIPIHALSIEVNFPSKFMKDDLIYQYIGEHIERIMSYAMQSYYLD